MTRFGIKGRYIVDRAKHREYPILAWHTSTHIVGGCVWLRYCITAQVPKRSFCGYPLGDKQTFLRSQWNVRGVY